MKLRSAETNTILVQGTVRKSKTEWLCPEEKLSLMVNGNPYTTTMRTPGDEEAHCRGILFTENVYQGNAEPLYQIVEENKEGIITKINVEIATHELGEGIHEKRNLLSVSSCGLCGKYEADIRLNGTLSNKNMLPAKQVSALFEKMAAQQVLFKENGGCHAAALFDSCFGILTVKEDIGRHNAVDKCIGHVLRKNDAAKAIGLLVSGRVSYEIVSKCFIAGLPFLCSVSAPSSLSVRLCREAGITLLAFCRDDRFTIYSGEQNIQF